MTHGARSRPGAVHEASACRGSRSGCCSCSVPASRSRHGRAPPRPGWPCSSPADDVAAGQTVGDDMVTTTEVEVGPGVRTLPAGDRAAVVGQVARGPIPAGTLLSPEMVTDGDAVPAGQAVVGAVLAPGAYPTAALRPGDPVQLVEAAGVRRQQPAPRARRGAGVGHHLARRSRRVGVVRLAARPAGPGGRRHERGRPPAAAAGARRERARDLGDGQREGRARRHDAGRPPGLVLAGPRAKPRRDRGRPRGRCAGGPLGTTRRASRTSPGCCPWRPPATARPKRGCTSTPRRSATASSWWPVLPAPAQAEACLRALGEPAASAIRRADVNAVVDCGRLHPSSPALPWAWAAERTLLVVRPRLDEVVALRPLAERLAAVGCGARPGVRRGPPVRPGRGGRAGRGAAARRRSRRPGRRGRGHAARTG